MKTITDINQDELVKLFATRIVAKDIKSIEQMLDPDGVFDIEIPYEEDPEEVSKEKFLEWFSVCLEENEILSVEYDQCLFCKIGNPVLMFNGGSFPVKPQPWNKPRTGLMLNINESGFIDQIQFCYTFVHSENNHGVSINGKLLNELLGLGYTVDEALKMLKSGWGEHEEECDFPF